MYYVIVSFFVIILFLFILFITSLVGAVVYISAIPIIKYFERRKRIGEVGIERIQFGLSFVVIIVAIYQTYRAFYPADSYYEGEYQIITSRELPSSGSVEKKSSSYPDLHGDYCSASIITLSNLHWRELLSQIEQDPKFELGKPSWSSVLIDVIGKDTEYEFNGFERNDRESDVHEYIGFIEGGSKLLLTRCVV